MSSKLKKKVPDDLLQALDLLSLQKYSHATDFYTAYQLASSKLYPQISLPNGLAVLPDSFSYPAIFGKQGVTSFRCAFPPGTRFRNDYEAPLITARQPTPSYNVDSFQEQVLVHYLHCESFLELVRDGTLRTSPNQYQLLSFLRHFYATIPTFTLYQVFQANVATQVDKSPALWLQLSLDAYKVAVQAGNSAEGYFLRQNQLVKTAEGDFNLENYYSMALNSVFDYLQDDFHQLIFGNSGAPVVRYCLPVYNLQREIASMVPGKLLYGSSEQFYNELRVRLEYTFGKEVDFGQMKDKRYLMPISGVVSFGKRQFVKILAPDPIVSVLMQEELTPDEQDAFGCYLEQRRLKMYRFIRKHLGIEVPGVKTVTIGEYVKPQTPKLSIIEQYSQQLEGSAEALNVPYLPRLRTFKSEEQQKQQMIAKKIAEHRAMKDQCEEVWLENGADEELYDDLDDEQDLDYFLMEFEAFARIAEFLVVYEVEQNPANKLLVNDQRQVTLNMSASALQSAQEKGSQRCITQSQSCANVHTYLLQCKERDPGSVLTFSFRYLADVENSFVRVHLLSGGKSETLITQNSFMLQTCDWGNGECLVVKFECLVKPQQNSLDEALSSNLAQCSRSGCLVAVSGRSYSESHVAVTALQGKAADAPCCVCCRSCGLKTAPVLPGYSMIAAVFEVSAPRLEPLYRCGEPEQEVDYKAAVTDTENDAPVLNSTVIHSSELPEQAGSAEADDYDAGGTAFYEPDENVSSTAQDALYAPPSRTPSRKLRARRATSAVGAADSFVVWLQSEDGVLGGAEYSLTVYSANNAFFAQDVVFLSAGRPLVQAFAVPFGFARECYDEQAGAHRFFVAVKARQISLPQADAKGKAQPPGLFPHGLRLFCFSQADFSVRDARLALEANEAQLAVKSAYLLQTAARARLMISFELQSTGAEAPAQGKKTLSSKPSSVSVIERPPSSAQGCLNTAVQAEALLAHCQVIELPPDNGGDKAEKPQSSNKLREPQAHTEQIDILRANAAILKQQSEDLRVLKEFNCAQQRFVVLDVPESLQIAFVLQKVENGPENIRIIVQAIETDAQPQLMQISPASIILNRITQTLFTKEFAVAADAFKRNCTHLAIHSTQNDVSKLAYASNAKGIVDVLPDKSKKPKSEIITSPDVMSQNIINQQKLISIDVRDEEPMFGVAGAKAKPTTKGKSDAGGFIDEICSELKDGVQRKEVERLFSITLY